MDSTAALRSDYEIKSADYFAESRPEMLRFIPANCRRLLDVGCGAGTFGESLKRRGNIEVWGVELLRSAAARAVSKLDRLIEGPFGPETELPAGTFDCIVFADVLEHMPAPEQALRYAKGLLAPGGTVVASIPNIRQLPVLWQLVMHGRWEYSESGLLDKTHLRFFTRSSIVKMFLDEGYIVENICGINAYVGIPNASKPLWAAYKLMNAFSLGKFADLRFQQFAVVAKPTDSL
jgi:2-polyprenyl-3-methyl-5-hydroxy-6-metoxy-1,4-benzoquinol methylase